MTSSRGGQKVHIRDQGGTIEGYFDTADFTDPMGEENPIHFDATEGQTFLVLNPAGSNRPTVTGDAGTVLHPPTVTDGPFILEITGDGELFISTNAQLFVMPISITWFHPQEPT